MKSIIYKGTFWERIISRCLRSKRLNSLGFWLIGRNTKNGKTLREQDSHEQTSDLWRGVEKYQGSLTGEHYVQFCALISSVATIKHTERLTDQRSGQKYPSRIVYQNGDAVRINIASQPARQIR